MTPRKIVARLEETIGLAGRPRRLVRAIEEELVTCFGLPAIQAAERAEAVSESVGRCIADRSFHAEENGIIAPLVLIGATNDIVAGSCHALPTDDAPVAAAKLGRMTAKPLLDAIRDLSFDEFETFGARVLAEVGAAPVAITPRTGDQGIDFYGTFALGRFTGLPRPFTKLAHDVVVAFVGQAKHYPHRSIGPNVVRELLGAVSLARTKTFSRDGSDAFPGLNLKPVSPLVALLFTTGKITPGAARLSKSAGIIARSGEQLAVFLSDKGVGIVVEDGVAQFDLEAFRNWLRRR